MREASIVVKSEYLADSEHNKLKQTCLEFFVALLTTVKSFSKFSAQLAKSSGKYSWLRLDMDHLILIERKLEA